MRVQGLKLEPDTSPYTATTLTADNDIIDGVRYTAAANWWFTDYSYGVDLGEQREITALRVYGTTAAGTPAAWYDTSHDSFHVYKSNDNSTWTFVETFDAPTLHDLGLQQWAFTLTFSSAPTARYFKIVFNESPATTIAFNPGGLSGYIGEIEVDFSAAAELAGWDYRIKLEIDPTYVDATVENWPVPIYISANSGISSDDLTAVFDELGSDANRKKIAVTSGDGETELYVEIERWDDANEEAWLWVKVPIVSAYDNTELYLYYDSGHADNTTYVGDTGDAAAQNVWDSFHLVYNFNQDPSGGSECILDSTSNANHGTPAGSMTSGDLLDGQIAKCLDFDGTDDEINLKSMISDSTMTIEMLYNCSAYGTWEMFCGKDGVTTDFFGFYDTSNAVRIRANNSDSDCSQQLVANSWEFLAAVLDGSNYSGYLDGSGLGSPAQTQVMDIDTVGYGFTVSAYHFTGKMCMFRISSVARSAAWIKLTHYALDDSVIEFGAVEDLNPNVDITADPITISLIPLGSFNLSLLAGVISVTLSNLGTYNRMIVASPIVISTSFNTSADMSVQITIVTDWRNSKGYGPWSFTEQGEKLGGLNNKRWTNDQNTVDFLDEYGIPYNQSDKHRPCGHWHKNPLDPSQYETRYNGGIDGVLDVYEYDITNSLYNFFFHITGNIYCIVYYKNSDGLYVRTVEIDSNGNITDPYIDSWEIYDFPPMNTFGGAMKLNGSVSSPFKVGVFGSYSTGADRMFLSTFSINSDGTINKAVIDTYTWGGLNSVTLHSGNFSYVRDNIYVCCYQKATTGHGRATTFSISGTTGAITYLDEASFYTFVPSPYTSLGGFGSTSYQNCLVVAYYTSISGADPERYKFYVKTMFINGSGALSEIDSYKIYSSPTSYPYYDGLMPKKIDNFNGVALAWFITGESVGRFSTFLLSNGNITFVETKTSWNAGNINIGGYLKSGENNLIWTIHAVVGENGISMASLRVESDGSIGELYDVTNIDNNLNAGAYAKLVEVSTNVWAVSYTGLSVDGYITTIGTTLEDYSVKISGNRLSDMLSDEPMVWPINFNWF